MFTLVGLLNCDTCKKATQWLQAQNATYVFRDVRKEAFSDIELLALRSQRDGWSDLINKSSTSWRELSTQQKAFVEDSNADASVLALIREYPTLLKRPILINDKSQKFMQGFKPALYEEWIAKKS